MNEFLSHIVSSTNMKCLTPPSALSGTCGFLAANLYAKSVFGEDALVNLSVEKGSDGKLSGYIRIRCPSSAPAAPKALGCGLCCAASAFLPVHWQQLTQPLQTSGARRFAGDQNGLMRFGSAAACDCIADCWEAWLCRSKTQGIALSLGDKLILKQKG